MVAGDSGFWHTAGMGRVVRLWACAVCLICVSVWGVVRAVAQDAATSAPVDSKPAQSGVVSDGAAAKHDATPTLKVYVNLVQIPVLVLTPGMRRVKPIAADRFSVSLDNGPQFRVTGARLEGQDPISLAIFLDTGDAQEDFLPKIEDAVAGLAAGSLTDRDEVSIYAMHCSLLRFVTGVHPEREDLKRAVKDALQVVTAPGGDGGRTKCDGAAALPDIKSSLGFAVRKLAREGGRRVVLAITDGNDGRGGSWSALRDVAVDSGVAVFGMTYAPGNPEWPTQWGGGDRDPFRRFCELTGGRVVPANEKTIARRMMQFVEEVRGRYIVEFPRPYHSSGGKHLLEVRIDRSKDFIRAAGISVPVADPARRADPMAVPEDPSLTPEYGQPGVPQ